MSLSKRLSFKFSATAALAISSLMVVACGPTVERPTGNAGVYEDAKDMFKRNKFDRALEFAEGLDATPPNKFTDRARVLRAVIFNGQIKAYKNLADSYTSAIDASKDPHHKAEFGQQRHDNLLLGGTSALNLGEVAQHILQGGTLNRELSLEAAFPATEGPIEVRDLTRMSEGGWVEVEQQQAAAVDALNKGMDDSLAAALGGDRSKARSTLAAGSVKLDQVEFSLYLCNALFDGAGFFDRKHIHDPGKYRTLLSLTNDVAMATLDILKDKPDKDKEAKIKKIQDQVKSALKTAT